MMMINAVVAVIITKELNYYYLHDFEVIKLNRIQ